MRMKGGSSRLLAVVLAVVTLVSAPGPVPAQMPEATPTEGAPPLTIRPAAKAGDQAVIDDIERTLRELSGVTVGARRININQPVVARTDVKVPTTIELAVGKSLNFDLPGDASQVVVGDPTVADVAVLSKRRLFVMARKAGATNVYVLDSSSVVLGQVEVQVGVDVAAVQAALRHAVPGAAVEVRASGPDLILTGSVLSDGAVGQIAAVARRFVATDQNLVNLVTVNREQQVLIQVRVAEVQRNVLKEIGVSTTVGAAPLFKKFDITGSTFVRNLVEATSPAGTFSFTGINGLLVALNILEERGLVRSLAEPNLVAVSGETASMLAGGEYPVPVPSQDGIKIEYKPFGVSLSFVPVVVDAGRINLKLITEVSALSSQSIDLGSVSANSFTVRRASSTVELPNGGSMMIAGLIQNDMLSGLTGIPGLMDVPILGQLFRSDSFKRNETELVVIVNASLVRPTAPANLVSPVDTVSPGGDLDIWAFGNLTGRYTPGFVQDLGPGAKQIPAFGFTIDEFMQ